MVVREITKGTIGITDAVMGLYTRYRGDTGDSVEERYVLQRLWEHCTHPALGVPCVFPCLRAGEGSPELGLNSC